MRADQHYEEFIRLLNAHEVQFLVVGAHALAYHARPRYTGDIDLWIGSDPINHDKLIKVLDEFGFSSLNIKAHDFEGDTVLQLGYEPNRIDLITELSGVTFDVCFKQAVSGHIGTEKVLFISKNHLIENKLKTGRKQDEADVEALKKTDT
ncbi:MAG: nucleotidyltransferase [Bacteroidota bacterium]